MTVTPPPAVPEQPAAPTWVAAGDGLSLRLEPPPTPVALGGSVELRLHFRNDGEVPRRIYLIQSEVFRALQSDLQVFAADGQFLTSQPDPHPPGYVVSERDFPAIAPGEAQVHTQTLHLAGPKFSGQAGPLRLRWTYRNSVESWRAGIQTLDGPTKGLFGGGPIPGIWRGEVVVEASLPLAR